MHTNVAFFRYTGAHPSAPRRKYFSTEYWTVSSELYNGAVLLMLHLGVSYGYRTRPHYVWSGPIW